MTMKQLGKNGPMTSALGLGGASFRLGEEQGEQDAIRTIQAGIDAGISFINTGDFYGSGQSEMLVGRAIRDRRESAFLSVKFGARVAPNGRMLGVHARPAPVKNSAAYSLQRLGVNVIDLYQPCRADSEVPYEETIGAVAELIQEGKVRYLGVYRRLAPTCCAAQAAHPVTALEIE